MGGQDGTSGTVTRGREGLVMRGLKEMKVVETYETCKWQLDQDDSKHDSLRLSSQTNSHETLHNFFPIT